MTVRTIRSMESASTDLLQVIRQRAIQLVVAFSLLRLLTFGFGSDLLVFGQAEPFAYGMVAIFAILYVVWFVLAALKRGQVAAFGLIATYFGFILLNRLENPLEGVVAAIMIATVIRGDRIFLVLFALLLAVIGAASVPAVTNGITTPVAGVRLLLTVALTGGIVRYFVSAAENALTSAERNANLLRIGAEVGQVTAGITTMDELLPRAINFIRDRFAFYHVQVFMVDKEHDVAILRASTGEVGKKLLERQHRLNVGSNSVIGRVTMTGEPTIARDTDRASVYFRNELLPNTRSELALPILEGDQVIGALDVQSTRPNAFQPNDVQALQIMANLLAAAIQNARLFEEQRRHIRDNQRLFIEAEANLREIQRLNRQLTHQSWEKYTSEGTEVSGVELLGNQFQRRNEWSELLARAIKTRQPVSTQADGSYQLAVPIVLRGEVIGAVEIEPESHLRETDIVEIMRAVSERLAVSLENARLFEEAQDTTVYEQRINDIVGQYQNANNVDDLLQITLSELSDILGAKHGAIRLTRTLGEDDDKDDIVTPTTNGANGATKD